MFPITIAVHKLHVFLAKVKFQFHQGRVFDQGLAKGIDFIAKTATELLDGQLMGTGMFGINEVANGLGLGKVSFAVQKGALGEFSGQRRATTGIDQTLHQPLSNERAAVNVAFYNVFPSKALRAAEREQQGFIEGLLTIVQNSQRCAAGLTSFEFASAQGVDNRPSLGSTDAHNRHSTASRWGRQGTNGGSVKGVCRHGGKLALAPFQKSLAPRYFCDRTTTCHYHYFDYPTS